MALDPRRYPRGWNPDKLSREEWLESCWQDLRLQEECAAEAAAREAAKAKRRRRGGEEPMQISPFCLPRAVFGALAQLHGLGEAVWPVDASGHMRHVVVPMDAVATEGVGSLQGMQDWGLANLRGRHFPDVKGRLYRDELEACGDYRVAPLPHPDWPHGRHVYVLFLEDDGDHARALEAFGR